MGWGRRAAFVGAAALLGSAVPAPVGAQIDGAEYSVRVVSYSDADGGVLGGSSTSVRIAGSRVLLEISVEADTQVEPGSPTGFCWRTTVSTVANSLAVTSGEVSGPVAVVFASGPLDQPCDLPPSDFAFRFESQGTVDLQFEGNEVAGIVTIPSGAGLAPYTFAFEGSTESAPPPPPPDDGGATPLADILLGVISRETLTRLAELEGCGVNGTVLCEDNHEAMFTLSSAFGRAVGDRITNPRARRELVEAARFNSLRRTPDREQTILPSLERMLPVIVALAARSSARDDDAQVALERLIASVIALDVNARA